MKKKIVIMSMLWLALTASASGQSNEVDTGNRMVSVMTFTTLK